MKQRETMERVKFTTTLKTDTKKSLEYIRIEKGFNGINETIEYLAELYNLNLGGFNNENKCSKA